ncbi:MAG: GGDEF domain-containing protein [Spirochaetaceae bacterium]|jgi:diguanylate cyclase (GGDEF)-like protein|nr:GGDEF domain-containing protein [Spirochaetaceae bacterium]
MNGSTKAPGNGIQTAKPDPADQDFLALPKVQEHLPLLRRIGVLEYIGDQQVKIRDYQDLFSSMVSIFRHTALEDILETAVFQITDRIDPKSIVFLWKSFQNKDEITIKGYRQYKLMDTGLHIETIAPFELFFKQNPLGMIAYTDLLVHMNNAPAAGALCIADPELVVPIFNPSSLYGMILIGGKRDRSLFSETELAFIQNFMYVVSLAIQNQLNYDHSLRDVKTGLYNYGFFMTRLTEELARMKRNQYVSSVIVVDVDFFKKFNDTYGHIAGDRVLEHIAALIKQGVRLEDVPARFGGEEFTVLLPDTNAEEAYGVAERLRNGVSQLSVSWDSPLAQVTISLGIFTFDNSTDSITEIVDRADKALYKSKERGRNCTTIWNSVGEYSI